MGVVMLEGEIRDIDLVARLVDLWREIFTGAIRFENDGIIKIIYFKGGDVLSASTNDRADSVDEILMRAGKVSREHVKQALAKRKETDTLGDTLLNLGFITRKELTWARRVQVVGVIRSIGEWGAGSYTIVADYLPKRDEGTIFPLPQIIVEMVVTDQDRAKFERTLESGSVVFTKVPDFTETYAKLGLNEEADAIVAQVDGGRSAAEVAAASGQDTFNAYKLLHALSLLGLLTRPQVAAQEAPVPIVAAPPMLEPLGIETAGVADAADAWTGPMPKFELEEEQGAVTKTLRTPAPPVLPPDPEPAVIPQAAAEEPQWGFDEAQIEAAQRATMPAAVPIATPPPRPMRDYSASSTLTRRPVPPKTIPKKSHFGLLVTLMALFIVAGVGYFGFMWWIGQSTPVQQAIVKRTTRKTAVPAPPVTRPAPVLAMQPPRTVTRDLPVPTKKTPPPPAPKPTPIATAPSPDRYAAMAHEFAASPVGKFTVQFEIVCDPSNITKALRTSATKVWFVPISLKGRSCYRVFWGRYETREAADRGMREIPAALREAPPSVVAVPR
jgi:uncharacterized protein DUF4388